MKPLNCFWVFLCLLTALSSKGQEEAKTQSIKGLITDVETKQPLIGVAVYVLNVEPMIGTTTDFNGEFTLENVPVGRQIVQAQYIGYEEYNTESFILNTAKIPFLEMDIKEAAATTTEIVVKANEDAFGVNRPLI